VWFLKDKKVKRTIYYGVEPHDQEKPLLETLKREGVGAPLPKWWRDGDFIRYIQYSQLDIKKAKEHITNHLSWVSSQQTHKLSANAKEILVLPCFKSKTLSSPNRSLGPLSFGFWRID
jgi:hypothetical protein